MRRSYAKAHFYRGDLQAADALFKQLTDEHPEWVWGYVGWGDLYEQAGQKDEARRLYLKGLKSASSDQSILEERLEKLDQ